MAHANIVFATPGHSVMMGYLQSLLATIDELSKRGITWAYANGYSSHVANAREVTINGDSENNIFERHLFHGKMTYDKLMWIDSDITFTPEDVIKLYESDKDIISGAYLLASGEVVAYEKILGKSIAFDELIGKTELIQVGAVGFGFVCVKQGVFESLTRPWFQSVNGTYIDSETKETVTLPIQGEDIAWCQRVADQGYKIWLDPTVKLIHTKMMRLTWEGPRP
jgi:GT2 family glycosyltransferase